MFGIGKDEEFEAQDPSGVVMEEHQGYECGMWMGKGIHVS